ncbi:MAG: methyltransferase domain-containing protein [Acidobacteria bacterium]|nr:methyltransferase domain-containing protein [Acidobacteriota bacterium]
MAEFTGERVIPGQVDPDLWNEHIARYHFAARLCSRKHVLDIACGTGYGAAELAQTAAQVTAIDISPEAIEYAQAHYSRPNLRFLPAPATEVPLESHSLELITAFEVIEHLSDWPALLDEAKRLLAPGGQFLVSTPNKAYYADSRRTAGPNPFHAHEFDFAEFDGALRSRFPHVTIWTQNHASALVFQPLASQTAAGLRIEPQPADPATAHFFLAVCALAPQLGAPAYVYLPASGNVLREREQHIDFLTSELVQKDAWLAQCQADHASLVDLHRAQTTQLEQRNQWAAQLNKELEIAYSRIAQLQSELEAEQAAGRQLAADYEAQLAVANTEIAERTRWAQDTESRLGQEIESARAHLAESNRLLQQAESAVEERTRWALRLQGDAESLQARLNGYTASRWVKLGRRIGLGPKAD